LERSQDMTQTAATFPSVAISSNSQVFNWAFFDHVTMGDLALQREVLGLFEAQLRQGCEQILAINDHDSWRYLTHMLRGAAAAVGANAIAELASHWESRKQCPAASELVVLRQQMQQAMLEFAGAARHIHSLA
jgi:HPt (histidine-containing phosphotransfer) domain-containing protein